MPHQWKAEQIIEPTLALQLIQEQFPELCAKSIRLLGAGWDNTAFVIDEHFIFRFPRRQIALVLLEAEWCALPKIASHLPLPIPIPKFRGKPTEAFPWPFIGYSMLPGFTACYVNLSEDQRFSLAEPIAKFLKSLHAISISEVAKCHIPEDNYHRIDATQLIPKIEKNFQELSTLGVLENRKKLDALNRNHYRAPLASSIVHGDFYIRHLLVDEKHHLCGVIDWGDMHIGDPAIDLSIAHSILPKNAHSAFKKAYGEISDQTWNLAQLRSIYSSTMLIIFGHHSQDSNLVREGLRALKIQE